MRKILILFLVFSSCKMPTKDNNSSKYICFPENPSGRVVSDYPDILTDDEELLLAQKLIAYEEKTTNQIVFVSIDSITPYTDIQKYATDLANHWGVGQKNKNNGLILVLSKPLRRVGIATGYGTEKVLTDSICKQVLEKTITPHFKEDRYYEGISNGLDSLINKWDSH